MKFYRRLIENHPFANITFAVVLLVGLLAYLTMPREQDPEINFNWVSICAFMPGAAPAVGRQQRWELAGELTAALGPERRR